MGVRELYCVEFVGENVGERVRRQEMQHAAVIWAPNVLCEQSPLSLSWEQGAGLPSMLKPLGDLSTQFGSPKGHDGGTRLLDVHASLSLGWPGRRHNQRGMRQLLRR